VAVGQPIERTEDRMLAGGRRTFVVGALEVIALEKMSVASVHRRSTARREAGDPLTSIRAFAGEPSGDAATVAGDAVRMEVQRETSRRLDSADLMLQRTRTGSRHRPLHFRPGSINDRSLWIASIACVDPASPVQHLCTPCTGCQVERPLVPHHEDCSSRQTRCCSVDR
jgi:hypothetical protein